MGAIPEKYLIFAVESVTARVAKTSIGKSRHGTEELIQSAIPNCEVRTRRAVNEFLEFT